MRNILDEGIASNGNQNVDGPYPVDNATMPYWRSEPHPLDTHRSTGYPPNKCDIAIIGAGLSGVSIAYHLTKGLAKEQCPSITIFEARQLCSGATARNGVRSSTINFALHVDL